jgi:predicted nucleotide-binding protein
VEATLAKRGKLRQVKKMSKSPKVKPPIFIGSSSEGYEIAKAVTALLTPQTQPTLWKDDVFLPGSFILETLEALTTNHYFAVFVASPDDNLTSRGQKYAAMRDNVLFECGLFMGAHGIKHALLICPDTPRIKLASDLGGIITATYNADKITKNPTVAVRSACQQVLKTIMDEWARMEREEARKLRALERAKEVKAAKKLNGLILRWIDATDSDFFEGFSNPTGFKKMKRRLQKAPEKFQN